MNIAILSGKGGTGKTLISVNLAAVAESSTYIDCDVEEPNGHLFLKPRDITAGDVTVLIPQVDNDICNGCRDCVDFCKFNALAYINDKLVVFDEICHSCGGCIIVCPYNALTEREKTLGKIEVGQSEQVKVRSGILNTGEPSGVPIINRLLEDNDYISNEKVFIDCPPGSACVVMDSIKDADYCILVAEPTIFGVHNLNMVYELVKLFNKRFGVVLNKDTQGDNPAEQFCIERDIKILGRIPFDSELGEMCSNAKVVARESDKYRKMFASLLKVVEGEVGHETTSNS